MSATSNLKMRSKLYFYAAYVTDVYDGDTITLDLDLGLGLKSTAQKIRFWKVNTPEIRGRNADEGKRVRDIVANLVLNKEILVRTILDKRGRDRTGKFGRLLGEILVENEDGEIINVNDMLLAEGLAIPMGAGGSTPTRGVGQFQALPETIDCPFCGEPRQTIPESQVVDSCSNCLDRPYPYA